MVVADLESLSAGKQCFHVHELADISNPDGTSAGFKSFYLFFYYLAISNSKSWGNIVFYLHK